MSTPKSNRGELSYMRLPSELKRELEIEAAKNMRSLTGEIVVRLRQSLAVKASPGAPSVVS